MTKLLKLALANWRRQRLRTGLTIGALTLAVAAVVFVYALSIAFQANGSSLVRAAIGSADLWVVPPDGVRIDRARDRLDARGAIDPTSVARIRELPGVTGVVPRNGWLTVASSAPLKTADALREAGITVTGDPTRTSAEPGAPALAYLVTRSEDRFSTLSFAQRFEVGQVNQVTSSVLGIVGRVTLALGFLSVLTSLLISIDERRREFGILAAVGITDDVLYLFLVESALVIAAGLVAGVLAGGALFGILLPSLFSVATVGKAIALASMYFPIMLILGALIPAHRLLKHTPLELLRGAQ